MARPQPHTIDWAGMAFVAALAGILSWLALWGGSYLLFGVLGDEHLSVYGVMMGAVALVPVMATLAWASYLYAMIARSLCIRIRQYNRPLRFDNEAQAWDRHHAFPRRTRRAKLLRNGSVRIKAVSRFAGMWTVPAVIAGLAFVSANAGFLAKAFTWKRILISATQVVIVSLSLVILRARLARTSISVELPQEPLHCGDTVTALLQVGSRRCPCHAKVMLECLERVIKQRESDRYEQIFSQPVFAGSVPAATGTSSVVPFTINIPADGFPSLILRADDVTGGKAHNSEELSHGGIEWRLTIAMGHARPGLPDRIVPLRVGPGDQTGWQMRGMRTALDRMKEALAKQHGTGGLELELLADAAMSQPAPAWRGLMNPVTRESGGLQVELQMEESLSGNSRFGPGEELRGSVKLANRRGKWKPLYVDVVVWYAHTGIDGLIHRERIVGAVANLVTQDRKKPILNGEQELPFSLRLPMIPFSYEGTSFMIRWYVGVYARGRWGNGPSEAVVPIRIG